MWLPEGLENTPFNKNILRIGIVKISVFLSQPF